MKHKNLLSCIKMSNEILKFQDIKIEKNVFAAIRFLFFKKL